MSEEMVRIQWPGADDVETVARSQVPPGYVRAHMQNLGFVWLDPGVIDRGGYKHGPMPPEALPDIERFRVAFPDCGTVEEWEQDFRRDRTPWREMAIWAQMTDLVERFTSHVAGDDETARAKREDVAALVLRFHESPPPDGVRLAGYRSLSAARVRDICAAVRNSGNPLAYLQRYRRLLRQVVLATPFPEQVPVDALRGEGIQFNLSSPFDSREFLGAADAVVAVDVETGRETVVYGRAFVDGLSRGDSVGPHRIARVTVDAGTDEMTWLLAAVLHLKGSYERIDGY